MQQNSIKSVILLALAGGAIGAAGLIAYYQQIRWLFIICAILCIAQLILVHFFEPLKDEMYPYLAACLAVGYYLTDSIPDTACFSLCLYYATAFIFSIVLSLIPLQIVLIIIPIGSIVAFILNVELLFLATGAFCFVYFLVKHSRGKNPNFAMGAFLLCVAFGVSMLFTRSTDTFLSVKILKGLLWGSAVYYIVVAIYAFYCARIKKGR